MLIIAVPNVRVNGEMSKTPRSAFCSSPRTLGVVSLALRMFDDNCPVVWHVFENVFQVFAFICSFSSTRLDG